MWSVWLALTLIFSVAFSAICTLPSSCSSEPPPESGQVSSLLQVGNRREAAVSPRALGASSVSEPWLKLSSLSFSASHSKQAADQPYLPGQAGQARAALPPFLFELGIQALGSEATLDAVVANTNYHNVTYSGENLYMRLVNGECCSFGTSEPDVYGLNSLNTLEPNDLGMLDMMDVGGNCGVVTVAAFKKEPKRLRVVAVEPVPSTFFLLQWNLYLNGVPQMSQKDFMASPQLAGVLALNNGVASTPGQVLGLCYTPPFTMNAKICNCADQGGVVSHQPHVGQCANVASETFGSLLSIFHSGPARLAFLKVDCEGCEVSLLPALDLVAQNPAWKLGRLAGELHAVGNAVEDVACKFEGGKWFEHICNTGTTSEVFTGVKLINRCPLGSTRKPCWHWDGSEGA